MAIDFNSSVVDRSRHVPVVVDFWAPWCGPCRVLGPIIEEFASQAAGRWELVKVNTEEQPDLARDYDILSIPAVKMFHQGSVVAEFVGALPAEDVRRWLTANLPDPRQALLEGIARDWETAGPEKLSGVIRRLESFGDENPDYAPGRMLLARAVVGRDPARARDLVASIGDADLAEPVSDVVGLADLMECRDGIPERLAPHLRAARDSLREQNLDGTLEHLVEVVMLDKRFGDELARRAAVALFRSLGQDHELTRKHQRRLSMALHS
jgi:putative thioredoxin